MSPGNINKEFPSWTKGGFKGNFVSWGLVYVIMDCGHEEDAPVEFIKIGYTTDPRVSNRLKALQTGNPRNLVIHSVLDMKDAEMARSLERIIHWNLDKYRVSGEWFRCTYEVKRFVNDVMPHLGWHFMGNPEDIFLCTEEEA